MFVSIGSNFYDTYADLDYANQYLEADPSADAWRAADDDTKCRALVSGTRVLNVLKWAGTPTTDDQVLAWPRTGVSGVADDMTPDALAAADCELANCVLNGIDIANFTSTASLQRRIKAETVEIENFRALASLTASYPLPKPAWVLISPYLGGGSSSISIKSIGTCGESILDSPFDHTFGL